VAILARKPEVEFAEIIGDLLRAIGASLRAF